MRGGVMKKYLGTAALALMLDVAVAKPLPPIGKRMYILDSTRPEIPATIEGINSPALEVGIEAPPRELMKDPIPISDKIVKESEVWKQPGRVVSKASKIKLQKLAVAGRYSAPRVPLEKIRQVIEPAEQPVKQDFQKKVLESEDRLKDLNW